MRARTLIAAMAFACMASSAFGQITPPTISVSGEATISVPPDLAQIDSGVTTEAKTRARSVPKPTTRRWAACCWR